MALRLKHPELRSVSLRQALTALSDPVRLEIVRMAAKREGQPCNQFLKAIPKSTASHHWRVLREAGLIRQEAAGTQRLNHLRREEFEKRFPGLLDAVLQSKG